MKRRGNKPKDVRQRLRAYEPGAYLYAGFGAHAMAGSVALLPFGVVFFTTQPVSSALTLLTTGGYIVGPLALAVFACGWAAMSTGLLYLMRMRDNLALHLVVYTVVGSLLLTAIGLLIYSGYRTGVEDEFISADQQGLHNIKLFAPILGALGAAIGRWYLDRSIGWYHTIARPSLPDVLKYEDRKRDKDDYKRM